MISGQRILLVDDEPLLLSLVRRVLAKEHPDVVVVYAADAATAEWQLSCTSIRLVVTDMKMSSDENAGLRVVRAARLAGVPVAVLTGGGMPSLEGLEGVPVLEKSTLTAKHLTNVIDQAFRA